MRRFRRALTRRHFALLLSIVALLFLKRKSQSKEGVIDGMMLNVSTKVPTIIFVETRFNGLGAQLLRLLDAFALAAHTSSRFCIHEGRYWNYGCAPFKGWSCYFESLHAADPPCKLPHACPHLAMVTHRRWNSIPCIVVTSPDTAIASLSLSKANLAICREFMKKLWRFNAKTDGVVRNIMKDVGLPDRYIGIHVRRGDKALEVPLQSLQKYTDAVALFNTSDVFIATDDGTVIESLREMLAPRRVYYMAGAESRQGHSQIRLNQGYMKGNFAKTIVLLAELEILRRADYFVGTFSSNMGRVVHLLREGDPATSISLDDRWAPGVAWKTFGQKYCRDASANPTYCRHDMV